MSDSTTTLSRLLPPPYPEMLARAADDKNWALIDGITDELAKRFPELVRRRADDGSFGSMAEDRRGSP